MCALSIKMLECKCLKTKKSCINRNISGEGTRVEPHTIIFLLPVKRILHLQETWPRAYADSFSGLSVAKYLDCGDSI